jgi:hypothetical protein
MQGKVISRPDKGCDLHIKGSWAAKSVHGLRVWVEFCFLAHPLCWNTSTAAHPLTNLDVPIAMTFPSADPSASITPPAENAAHPANTGAANTCARGRGRVGGLSGAKSGLKRCPSYTKTAE